MTMEAVSGLLFCYWTEALQQDKIIGVRSEAVDGEGKDWDPSLTWGNRCSYTELICGSVGRVKVSGTLELEPTGAVELQRRLSDKITKSRCGWGKA